jgi:hypothetical protein
MRLLYFTALQHDAGRGAMERDKFVQLLAGTSQAVLAARIALTDGASYVVWDGAATSAKRLASIYGRRLRHTRRTGQRTLSLEETVEQLRYCDQPVLLGKISSGAWAFIVFIAADTQSLIACTAVERRPAGQRPTL